MEPLRSYEVDSDTCAERRASRRVRVTCAASLQTMTTMTYGNVVDISETGARFEAEEPPGKGATALLKWGEHEAVCTIIWHDDGACGVWFKQPLNAELVAETAAMDHVMELPIASVGNITQGRKRSMPFLKRAVRDSEEITADTAPPSALHERAEPSARVATVEDASARVATVEDASARHVAPGDGASMSDVIRSAFRAPFARRATTQVTDVTEIEHESGTGANSGPDPQEDTAADPPTMAIAAGGIDEPIALEPPFVEEQACAEPERSDEPIALEPPSAAEDRSFGRTAGLTPPSIGHNPTLAEVLRRYRDTGSWER